MKHRKTTPADHEHHSVEERLDNVTEGEGSAVWMHDLRKGSRTVKIYWIGIMLVCIIGLVGHVYQNVSVYFDEGTSSEINPWVPTALPDMSYCISNYYDMAKVQAVTGWSDAELYTFDSLIPLGIVGAALSGVEVTEYLTTHSSQDISDHVMSANVSYQTVKAFIEQRLALKPNTTFEDIVSELSIPTDEVATAIIHMVMNMINITSEERLTTYGRCVVFKFSEVPLSRFQAQYMRGHIRVTMENQSPYGFYYLFVGPQANSVNPSAQIPIRPGQSYVLNIQGDHVRRVPTKYKPCSDTTEYERSKCIAECFNTICSEAGGCINMLPYGPIDPSKLDGLCNHLLEQQRIATDNSSDPSCFTRLLQSPGDKNCYEICPSLCVEEKFSATLSLSENDDYDEKLNGEAQNAKIYLGYENPMQAVEINQFISVPLDTFLSNLGGTIALWSGASVFSLAQVISLFVFTPKEPHT